MTVMKNIRLYIPAPSSKGCPSSHPTSKETQRNPLCTQIFFLPSYLSFYIVLAGQAAVIIPLFWHGENYLLLRLFIICGRVDTSARWKYIQSPAAITSVSNTRKRLILICVIHFCSAVNFCFHSDDFTWWNLNLWTFDALKFSKSE